MELTACNDIASLQKQHRKWLSDELAINRSLRDVSWTESLAVGNQNFVDEARALLGIKASKRNVVIFGDKHVLREDAAHYNAHFDAENSGLSQKNTLLWGEM